MKKSDYFTIFILAAIAAAGCWVNGFIGGIMAGFAFTFLIAVGIGKWLANRAISRINKIVKDTLLSNA